MAIEDANGRRVALVKKALVSPLRDRWVIKPADGEELTVQGNIVDHEYAIERDGYKICMIRPGTARPLSRGAGLRSPGCSSAGSPSSA
jgi:uncharacterized protein YxjI